MDKLSNELLVMIFESIRDENVLEGVKLRRICKKWKSLIEKYVIESNIYVGYVKGERDEKVGIEIVYSKGENGEVNKEILFEGKSCYKDSKFFRKNRLFKMMVKLKEEIDNIMEFVNIALFGGILKLKFRREGGCDWEIRLDDDESEVININNEKMDYLKNEVEGEIIGNCLFGRRKDSIYPKPLQLKYEGKLCNVKEIGEDGYKDFLFWVKFKVKKGKCKMKEWEWEGPRTSLI